MRKFFISIFLFFIFLMPARSQDYNNFFQDKAFRIDFQLCGDEKTTTAWLHQLSEEPFWGGRRAQLSTDLNLGQTAFRFSIRSAINLFIPTDSVRFISNGKPLLKLS